MMMYDAMMMMMMYDAMMMIVIVMSRRQQLQETNREKDTLCRNSEGLSSWLDDVVGPWMTAPHSSSMGVLLLS